MVECLFNEQTDYPVGIEDEICTVGLDVADLAVRALDSGPSEVADGGCR